MSETERVSINMLSYASDQEERADILRCMHCGEAVSRSGPETWHTKSTMIRCEPTATKATVADV